MEYTRYLLLLIIFIYLNSCTYKSDDELLEHPNVLFISLDDMNDWVEPLSGNSQSLTPNLLKFNDEAVNFTKNYCASPGCNPSRSALMTGIHTFRSGMYSNYQDWREVPVLNNVSTMSQHFRNDGINFMRHNG